MKLIFTSVLCLCVLPFSLSDHAQARSVPEMAARTASFVFDSFPPFDTYGEDVSPRDEKARLDNLVFSLRKEPDHVVYIFVYAGRLHCPGEAQKRLKRVRHHLVKTRGIAADRVILQDGGYREIFTVELFLWPRVSSPPSPVPIVDHSEARIRSDCQSIPRRCSGRHNSRKQ